MITLLMRALHVLFSGVVIAIISSPLAQASPKYAAKRFMNGGTFCFAQGEQLPGEKIKTVKMVVRHQKGGAPNQVAHVDALMYGAEKVTEKSVTVIRSYFDEVSGAATIAPPNDLITGLQQLQIGLTGTSYGTNIADPSKKSGVWRDDYAVTLSTTALTGRIYGIAIFNTVENGTLGETFTYAINDALTPIPCAEFTSL